MARYISWNFKFKFAVRKCKLNQKWNKVKLQCECKSPIKNRACK